MTTSVFRSLVWKDVRLNLVLLVGVVVVWLMPFVMIPGYKLLYERAFGDWSWSAMIPFSAYASLTATVLTALLLGANAFAAERSDRSAEFLALLPATRRQVVGSKLLVALVPLAVVWAADLAVILSLDRTRVVSPTLVVAAFTLLFFGLSWLGSVLLDRPMTALGVPVIVMFLILLVRALVVVLVPDVNQSWLDSMMVGGFAALGLGGLVAGTWIALRQVEP